LNDNLLSGKAILITGAARRIGRAFALAVAQEGATVLLHYGHSIEEAYVTQKEILNIGGQAFLFQADLENPGETANLVARAAAVQQVFALVNNAAIFQPLGLADTRLDEWNRHLAINLTAPFLLSQAFSAALGSEGQGRIVNILDWRAIRPGPDHLPYTISKAGLAALTRSLAIALAPNITVNGIALGAILPPSSGEDKSSILKDIPAGRWAKLDEVSRVLIFLLAGPAYITGEIIHLDGGRHLT
jgi:pteridine reductase